MTARLSLPGRVKCWSTAFHPELTDDLRFHQYFLDIVAGNK